jgi:hypothetical protein
MRSLLVTALILVSMNVFAHGGDKPGPNGGEVQMPGAFHTEMIRDNDNQDVMVFLLDMEFKNPTLKDSSVTAFYQKGKTNVAYTCSPMHNHFHCVAAKKFKFEKDGEIHITAVREKAKGNEAVYKIK